MSRYAVAYVDIANGFELDSVAACVIGGISIAGGVGSVAGTVLGALFLGVIKNALPVIDISPFTQMAISGTVIILAVVFNARRERNRGRIILRDQAAADTPARRWPHEHRFRTTTEKRVIPDRLGTPFRRIMASWEVLLFGVAILIFIFNSLASPYFLDAWNLSDATFNFTEKAMIAFAMALLVIAGEIDLSVAAIIALASTAMGAAAQVGVGTPGLVAIGIGIGLALRHFQRLSRLSAETAVDRRHHRHDEPVPRHFLYRARRPGLWQLSRPISPISARAMSSGSSPSNSCSSSCWRSLFAILLHATNFGRQVYTIGNNDFAARFSGIPVERVKFILFLLTGVMSGIAAVCLTSRLGSTRPSIAQGWELEVVTMVVLGGVSILGGSGTIGGVVIAAFVMGLVTFGLGLLNVPGIVMSIFIGLLLIITIAMPIVARRIKAMSSK